MAVAQRTHFEAAEDKGGSHDLTIVLGYTSLSILLLIAIYLGSGTAGPELADFATMTAFP